MKYICIGGYVDGKTDKDRHYISPHRLPQLYGVNPKDCYFARDEQDNLLLALDLDKLIELRPRYNGDYTTPTKG